MSPPSPADLLASFEPGARVVARHRVPGGFTDALGYLRSCDERSCRIETRRGIVDVPLVNVVAAKRVPEPPRRPPDTHPPDPVSPSTTGVAAPPSRPARPA